MSFYITEKRYSTVINHCTRTADKSVIVSVKSYASAVDFQNINSVFGKRIIDCAVGGYGTVFTDANGEAVIDYLKDWDSDEWSEDDIRDEEPRWINNGTDSIHQKDGYTLIYNSTLGGVYMLYREANEHEIQWYKEQSI